MKLHFIAIGGSIMHSLAIALKRAGHQVSGSDDRIYDPARKRLAEAGLLPSTEGWDPGRISDDLDAVVLGMHAFEDNPELQQARKLGVPVYSFPEFIYNQSKHKHRVVIAGSYGKTTVTAMVMHVLQHVGKKFDYLVGGDVPGFDNYVRLSDDAPLIVMEGDEYLASRIDPRPKFLLYRPHMVVITGISWDHINVFPSEEVYIEQFVSLLKHMDKASNIIYHSRDKQLARVVKEHTDDDIHYLYPYNTPSYKVKKGVFTLKLEGQSAPVKVIGRHNMDNIAAAWEVCRLLSVEIPDFMEAIQAFEGVHMRMETVVDQDGKLVIRDYAHAPAKVKATVEAVRERYRHKNLIACVELHTFSSLNKSFLPHYQGSLRKADSRVVYVDPKAVEARRMEPIGREDLTRAFGEKHLIYATSPQELQKAVSQSRKGDDIMLFMSSGNFGGLDLGSLD